MTADSEGILVAGIDRDGRLFVREGQDPIEVLDKLVQMLERQGIRVERTGQAAPEPAPEYAQAIAAAGWLIDYLDNQTVDGEVAERIREWLENPIVQRARKEASQ